MTTSAPLPPIPLVDVREGGALRHARDGAERARLLREECLAFFPRAMRPLLPLLDRLARRWLSRSQSPYVAEIGDIAKTLGFSGTWFLNGSYQWACTTRAREEEGVPWLARTLDWPFPGLGRHADLVRMQGPAGEFYSVAWPGYVGALTAMAPGRFAAVVNQAPMWRRTLHPWLRPYDMVANAIHTWTVRHVPPDQLLRQAFETCRTFEEARERLETTPLARPVIYTLVGCKPGETCVIERTEESFYTRYRETLVANDWHVSRVGWEGRIPATIFLTCSFEGAAENSRARCASLGGWSERFADDGFGWVVPPVLNPYTRLAVVMCPARGTMRVCGYEAPAPGELPQPVTASRTVEGVLEAA
jgi:hypothetical protein